MTKPVDPDPEAPLGRKVRTGEPRKSPPQGGRPCLLEPPLVQKIVDALSVMAPQATACAYAGINTDTFHRWLKRGARDARKGKNTKYSRFSEEIEKALAKAEVGCLSAIMEAGVGKPKVIERRADGSRVVQEERPGQWQALAWMLERRKHRKYARRTYRIEDGPVAAGGGEGVVETYRVCLPAVDPEPGQVAPPHTEAAREEQGGDNAVKCNEHDSGGGGAPA